jgi:predicted acylesterase/phospholipase RssA
MSGGGARAAYQVGVLRAIADMLPQRARNPFGIICGTSAGSVNAASLASDADRFDRAVSRLARTWGTVHIGHVYRANLQGAILNLFRGDDADGTAGSELGRHVAQFAAVCGESRNCVMTGRATARSRSPKCGFSDFRLYRH